MRNKIILALVSFGLFVTVGAGGALAQSADDALTYRKSVFQAIKWHFGPLVEMAKGNLPYSPEQAQHHADALAALAKMIEEGFPAGSDQTTERTRALPKIWQDWDGFTDLVNRLETTTAEMASSAGGGRGAIAQQVRPIGGTCKECHDSFRAK